MTKQELIAHFQEQKKIIEREIVFWQAQPDAEAEKPKLRHGDFGIWNGPKDDEGWNTQEFIHLLSGGKLRPADNIEYYAKQTSEERNYIILGNIFDLLKEWSEDFERFDIPKSTCNGGSLTINIRGGYIEFWVADEICTTIFSEAYEAWCKLGHALMFLKRKQSLT